MENRIKEQLMLFSDRTSTHYLRSNQLRLYFSSVAYVLLQMLRRLGLEGTELAQAQCSSIRLKLLKIGARSEERRVGKECRARWWGGQYKKNGDEQVRASRANVGPRLG